MSGRPSPGMRLTHPRNRGLSIPMKSLSSLSQRAKRHALTALHILLGSISMMQHHSLLN